MRLALLTTVMVIFGSAAQAGSIESIVSAKDITPSQTKVICVGCPPVFEKKFVLDSKKWTPSDEKIDVKEVNGVKKRFSKEAWFGGSPVTFVTTVPGEKTLDAAAVQPMPGVDPASQTSALNDIKSVEPMKAEIAPAPADAPMATDVAAAPAETPVAKPKPILPRLNKKPEATGMDAMTKPEPDMAKDEAKAANPDDPMQMDAASPKQDGDDMKLRVN